MRPVKGCAGLPGASAKLGLSDHEILEREFIVYDAPYAECKRQANQA
jgi:hypothetical protein